MVFCLLSHRWFMKLNSLSWFLLDEICYNLKRRLQRFMDSQGRSQQSTLVNIIILSIAYYSVYQCS